MLDVFSNIDFTGAKIQGYTYSRDQFQSMIEVKLPSQIILRFLFHPVVIFKYYSRNEFSKFVCVKCNQDHSSLNEFRFLDAQDNVHIMIKAFSFSVSSESDFSLKKNNFLCEKIVLMDNLKINSFEDLSLSRTNCSLMSFFSIPAFLNGASVWKANCIKYSLI